MFNCVHPETAINIYRTAVKSVLISGCSAIQLSKDLLSKFNRTQGKLVKAILSISYIFHTTPILEAIGVSSVSTSVATNSMGLLCACLYSDSIASQFYIHFLNNSGLTWISQTLVGRVYAYLNNFDNFIKLLINDSWKNNFVQDLLVPNNVNGLTDTICVLIINYGASNRKILNSLLKSL